ncbi:DNA polymerase delta subunit 3 [Bufo gargarizans]|uniref:DNA polymerase delta subunit 3 n=1 Tax=Bufo gargarizans TaxID=30331 RepID=UPI001CF2A507|nr:DNA polymerase delta subunit 3 [Bufo gargarizans]
MDELYLENIDELVTDHNKIVTYKWLSLTLGVHINQAKQMLYDYVTRKRKENLSAQVHVTYLVTGKCLQDGYHYHKVAVVREEKLEAAKSKLALVASVHVYSIQKAVLKDSAPLFSTDYDIIKNNLQNCNKFSAIQCPAAVPRSPEEIAQLQRSQPSEAPTTPAINGQASPPAAKPAPQPKGIMGMFSRAATKSQESQKDTKTEAKEPAVPETSSKQSAKSSAMNNFFGKASMHKVKEAPTTSEPLKEEKAAAPQMEFSPPETKEDSEPPKAAAKSKKSKSKRVEMSDSDEEQDKLVKKKKRRRIKKPQPDSSDEEHAGPLPPEVKTPSPPPSEPIVKMETEPESQTQPGVKRRKRKRVLKSKTFIDAEGSMVTEKVYESESCTDSDDFAASKPSAKPPAASKPETKAEPKTTKKAAAAKGTKQASIMGFFQKK